MESLHNDGLARGVIGKGSRSGGGRRVNLGGNFLRLFACWLLCGLTIWFGVAQAQTTYVHDANGRVVAVTQNDGTTTQYTYDALGHVGPVSAPLPAEQLAIFAFMPTHGDVGVQVTIEGQGFSTSLANDGVSFNGSAATILSASPAQLVVNVPNGATTGPISVTVGGQTVTSATPFVVDDTGLAPVITQISPAAVVSGNTVTITGENLYPVPQGTTLELDGSPVALSSATDTQLQFFVTSAMTSGNVTVTTPSGQAVSSTPVVVVPSAEVTNSIVSSGYTTAGGPPVALNIGAAGQVGVVAFSAMAGSWLSLQATGITTTATNIAYAIYAPGDVLVQEGTVSSSSPSIHLPALSVSGTYVAVFQPNTSGAQLTIAVESDAALVVGTPLAVATSTAWQSQRLTFTLSAVSNMELSLANLNASVGSGVYVNVYNAAGSQIGSFQPSASLPGDAGRLALWNLAAGTYSVVASPVSGGTMSFNAVVQPDVIGPVLTPSTPTTVNLGVGQLERLTFNANAGDTYALQLSGASTAPANQTMYVYIYSPTTTTITPSNFYASFTTTSSSTINLSNLPASGTYIVMVFTTGLAASGQLTLVSGDTGSLPSSGAPQSYSTGTAGQNVYLTFTATAGANLELALDNLSVSAGTSVNVSVYNAAGSYVSGVGVATSNPGNAERLALWNLAAGTYSVVVSPVSGGTMSFNAMVQPDVIGPVLTPGTPIPVNLGVGQLERLTFNANAGDTYALQLSGVSTTPANQTMYVYVYSPTTTTITPSNYYTAFTTTSSSTINLSNLPASGTYTVMVFTAGFAASGQLTLVSGDTGSLPSSGMPQSYSTGTAGQNVYLTFTATAGANLELALDNLSVSEGTSVNVGVYNAAGSNVSGVGVATSNPGDAERLALWNLSAGTYSVVVSPSSVGTMSFNALLQPDVVGPTLTVGTPTTVSLGTGQIERLTFSANAGDNVQLQLSGVSSTPANWGMSVYVYSPTTTTITTSNQYASSYTTSSSTINISSAPASGTYTVIVYTQGYPASGQMTLLSQ